MDGIIGNCIKDENNEGSVAFERCTEFAEEKLESKLRVCDNFDYMRHALPQRHYTRFSLTKATEQHALRPSGKMYLLKIFVTITFCSLHSWPPVLG